MQRLGGTKNSLGYLREYLKTLVGFIKTGSISHGCFVFEFDPERALWKPGRRSFLFMFGAALVAPMLPEAPKTIWINGRQSGDITLRTGENFTVNWYPDRCASIQGKIECVVW